MSEKTATERLLGQDGMFAQEYGNQDPDQSDETGRPEARSAQAFLESLKRIRKHLRRIEIFSGALLIVLGTLVATNRLTTLNRYFFFLNDVVEAAERWLL